MNRNNRIGLGTVQLSGIFGKIDASDSKQVITTFLENGGYYIDTAPLYGFGEVEELLGQVLKNYQREKYFITNKCGYTNIESRDMQHIRKSSKYVDVISECEKSLKRLRTDFIDLYLVHTPDPLTPFEETMSALEKLQQQGKICFMGASNLNLSQLTKCNTSGKIKYLQNRLSLIHRSVDGEFENYLLKNQISFIPYQVLERGQLSEGIFSGKNWDPADHRLKRPEWQSDKVQLIKNWVKNSLAPLAQKAKLSVSELSLAWVLQKAWIAFVPVGAARMETITANLRCDSITLDEKLLKEIETAYHLLESLIREKHGQTVSEFRGISL